MKRAVNKITGDMGKDLVGYYYHHNDGVIEYLQLNKDKTFHYYNNVVEQGQPGAYDEYGVWSLKGSLLQLKSNISTKVERRFVISIEEAGLRVERDKSDNPLTITYIGEMSPKQEKFVRYIRVNDEKDALNHIDGLKKAEDEKARRLAEREGRRRKREEERRKKDDARRARELKRIEEREAREAARKNARKKKRGSSIESKTSPASEKSASSSRESSSAVQAGTQLRQNDSVSDKSGMVPMSEVTRRLEAILAEKSVSDPSTVDNTSAPTKSESRSTFKASRETPAFNKREKLPVSPGFLGHYVYQTGGKFKHQIRFVENNRFYFIGPGGKITGGDFRKENSRIFLDDGTNRRRFRYIREGYKLILYRSGSDRNFSGGGITRMMPTGNDPVVYRKLR